MKINKCECGRRMSKDATECKKCYVEKITALKVKACAIVKTGKCPDCGSPLRRNLALAGWWQCSQYGSEDRRLDSSKPGCGFQTFTE